MEENREDIGAGDANEGGASGGEQNQSEGMLVDAARAVGSAIGTVAGVVGGVGEIVAGQGDGESVAAAAPQHRRQEKIGLVTSDKMEKTVVVRVERQVRHPKYKRYIRRRSKFMAHNEMGAGMGDLVRIVETRPLSARKRWRVVEIIQKAR